jgi:hypothetical protein
MASLDNRVIGSADMTGNELSFGGGARKNRRTAQIAEQNRLGQAK